MAWVQFIFDSTHDLAPALSDHLTECGAGAVTLEDSADQPLYEPGLGETPLWQSTRVIALFPADQDSQQIDNMLAHFLSPEPIPHYRVEAIEDKDWEREWMDNFHPIQFGERLWICPSWHTPPDPDATNIMLDPGLAFGTGTHPTTALCLNWLDQADVKDKIVIDYGCGSGILAIAAALLGAKKVIGVDTDPQALKATQENAIRNHVSIETYLPKNCPDLPADILLANILAGPLTELAPTLASLTLPDADLVLSGILESQAADLSAHYARWFDMQPTVQSEEWIRLNGNRHERR